MARRAHRGGNAPVKALRGALRAGTPQTPVRRARAILKRVLGKEALLESFDLRLGFGDALQLILLKMVDKFETEPYRAGVRE